MVVFMIILTEKDLVINEILLLCDLLSGAQFSVYNRFSDKAFKPFICNKILGCWRAIGS